MGFFFVNLFFMGCVKTSTVVPGIYILLFFGKLKHKFIFFLPQESQKKSTLVIFFFMNQMGFSQADPVRCYMHKIGENEADE